MIHKLAHSLRAVYVMLSIAAKTWMGEGSLDRMETEIHPIQKKQTSLIERTMHRRSSSSSARAPKRRKRPSGSCGALSSLRLLELAAALVFCCFSMGKLSGTVAEAFLVVPPRTSSNTRAQSHQQQVSSANSPAHGPYNAIIVWRVISSIVQKLLQTSTRAAKSRSTKSREQTLELSTAFGA